MNEKLITILEDIQPDFDFTQDVHFIENGFLDSLDVVQLVVALEDEFKIRISALDIIPENFCSLKAMSDLIEKSSKL